MCGPIGHEETRLSLSRARDEIGESLADRHFGRDYRRFKSIREMVPLRWLAARRSVP